MSTILRALKKLEQDTDTDSGVLADAIVGSPGRRDTKTFITQIVIIAAGIAFIAAGGFFLTRKSPTPGTQTSSGKTGDLMTTAKKTAAPVAQNRLAAPTRQTKAVPKHFRPAEAANSPPPAIPSKPSENMKKSLDTGRNTADAGAGTKASAQQAPAPRPPVEALAPSTPPVPVPAPSAGSIKVLSDSAGLTLQAISWSTDAAGRIAVINGQVCREGDQVDGYIVRQIDPDDVIVSNDATTGKLSFK